MINLLKRGQHVEVKACGSESMWKWGVSPTDGGW